MTKKAQTKSEETIHITDLEVQKDPKGGREKGNEVKFDGVDGESSDKDHNDRIALNHNETGLGDAAMAVLPGRPPKRVKFRFRPKDLAGQSDAIAGNFSREKSANATEFRLDSVVCREALTGNHNETLVALGR
ncbi:MAG TPA: hypothetical protein VJ719_04110 [Chthoniobacterales bacterium]|nr:hypothetical protein [Chthoniobacterales bacterium]